MTPSTAAKDYFRNFDAGAARDMTDAWDETTVTHRQIVDGCLLNIYACATINGSGYSFPLSRDSSFEECMGMGLATDTGLSYTRLLRDSERSLVKLGFQAKLDDYAELSWPCPETHEDAFRFIELLPSEVNSQSILKIMRAKRMAYATDDDLVKVMLLQVMAVASIGRTSDAIRLGKEGIFHPPFLKEPMTENAAGIPVVKLVESAKVELEKRGFTLNDESHISWKGELEIAW